MTRTALWTALQKKGGVLRTAVSGKTDYLVCDPLGAGESKINAAIEQNKNGKNIRIILFSDFLDALYGNTSVQTQPSKVSPPKAPSETPTQPEKTISRNPVGSKIAEKNERIIVNDDFSIIIPEKYRYSVDKSMIHTNRALVFIKTEENSYFKEKWGDDDYSLGEPFGAPRCLTVVPTQQFESALDLTDTDTILNLKKLISMTSISLAPTDDGEDNIIAIKETKDALVYVIRFGEESNTSIYIVTPNVFYTGQIWLCDIEPDEDKMLGIAREWLNTIEAKDFSGNQSTQNTVPKNDNPPQKAPENTIRPKNHLKEAEEYEKQYEAETKSILKNKKQFIEEKTKKEEEKYRKESDTLKKDFEKDLKPLKDAKEEKESLVASKTQELQSLGWFSLFKKSNCKKEIAEYSSEVQKIKSQIATLKSKHTKKCNELNEKKETAVREIKSEAEKKFLIPEKKHFPTRVYNYYEDSAKQKEEIKEAIIDILADYGDMTYSQMNEELNLYFTNITINLTNALLRQLVMDGVIERKEIKGIAYYSL